MMNKNINIPFALDYKEATLGALPLETKAMPTTCQRLRPKVFYDDKHQIISAIESIFNEGHSINIITVTEELKRRGKLDKVDGPFAIVSLSSGVASLSHLETHAQTLKDYFIRRELIKGLSNWLSKAVDMPVFTDDLRESGAIEQDADIVLLLHRPALYKVATDKESGYPTEGLGILSIAKHRNGETGNVYFSHNKSMTKIADYVPPMEWLLKQAK